MQIFPSALSYLILLVSSLSIATADEKPSGYNPARKAQPSTVVKVEFQYDDRIVPLKFYLPKDSQPAPVILLSHGLGGSREVGQHLGEYWAGHGYVVVAMQHAGSDESVWKGVRLRQRMAELKKAASRKNFMARNQDVKETLNHLQKLNKGSEQFRGRFDMNTIGMSGHSFGAVTTQAVSGQNFGLTGKQFTDARIKAAMLMSPSPPAVGFSDQTFGGVDIPWLLMTGTKDSSPIGRNSDPESRRKVFQGLPAANRCYELCLWEAEHSAFSDVRASGRKRNLNPNHHVAIHAISLAFWDAYLRQSEDAKKWLQNNGPRKVLEAKDSWLKK
ncbi:MAG: dienelactone hydrolase [Fuerstiella sp.]